MGVNEFASLQAKYRAASVNTIGVGPKPWQA
jgi:hypothetical protein